MKYILSTKGFTANEHIQNTIQKGISKLEKRMGNMVNYNTQLSIIMKKHDKHTYFSGQLSLPLPNKVFIAKCHGHNEQELLQNGFITVLLEYERYKGKHFAGSSDYPDRKTIRKDFMNNA